MLPPSKIRLSFWCASNFCWGYWSRNNFSLCAVAQCFETQAVLLIRTVILQKFGLSADTQKMYKKMRVNAWFQSDKLICEEFKSSIWIKFRLVRLTVHLALMIPKFRTCKHRWPVIRICFTLHKVELR